MLDVYAAREDPSRASPGGWSPTRCPGNGPVPARPGQRPAVAAGLAKPGDLVLTMGAGDVTDSGR